MKNITKYVILVVISLFMFNISFVNAEVMENETLEKEAEIINNETNTEEDEKEEKKEEIIIETTTEVEAETNVLEEINNNEGLDTDGSNEEIVSQEVQKSEDETVINNEPALEVTEKEPSEVPTIEEPGKEPSEVPTIEEPEKEMPTDESKVEADTSKNEDAASINNDVTKADAPVDSEAPQSQEEEKPVEEETTSNNEMLVQRVKVITTKVDEDGNALKGAKLVIIDSDGNFVDEWVSDGTDHETMLKNGEYILREIEAPKGYVKAEDQSIVINVKIPDISAGVDFDSSICDHHKGFALYYVKSVGETEEDVTIHEVYCINQNWEVPDQYSTYTGQILNPSSIKDYTKQTVPTDASKSGNKQTIDISDPNLKSEELYNKMLDIIYHKYKAREVLKETVGYEYTDSEIRFITEAALKNYTNAGMAEVVIAYRKRGNITYAPLNVPGVIYEERSNGDIYYLRHNYRDYVYVEDTDPGEDIAIIDFGKGTSFGQIVANHWNGKDHNAKADNEHGAEERARVKRYYELFKYLISDEDKHPNDMHLYIYSSTDILPGVEPDGTDNGRYQNLLGVTGYIEDFKPQDQHYIVKNTYSNEKTNIPVKKIWNDSNDQDGKRPENIKVTLYADKKEIRTVLLSDDNDWSYTFTDLPIYNKGKEIKYEINEVEVKDYETKIDGFTITNTHKVEKTNIPVKKIWDDNNNQDGKRPENIEIILYADKVEIKRVLLNEKNQWSYTFEDLDVYNKGKEIKYEIDEVEVKDYETKIDGFTITNTHKVEKRNIPVIKIWEDKEDYCKLRPKSVTIHLFADEELIETVTLDKSNDWSYEFKNLDVYKNGNKIKYTISEDEVPEYYTEIDGNMEIGFTVTNTHFGEGDDNPKTLDNIIIYIMMLLVSIAGITKYSYSYIKSKN